MNLDQKKKYTVSQYYLYEEFKSYAQVGDIVISQTDNMLFSFARSLLKVNYDHISVMIKEDQIFHISWPKIRIVHPIHLISQLSKFIVIRPTFQKGELEKFIKYLETSLNASYDLSHFFQGAQRKLLQSIIHFIPQNYETKVKKNRVCTDLIFYSLDASSQIFRELLQKNIGYLDYHLIGSFTPDDLFTLVQLCDYFKVIKTFELPPSGDNSFTTLKKVLKSQDLMGIINSPLLPVKQLLKKISAPEDLFVIGKKLIGSLNLLNLILLPRKQQIKMLVMFIIKRVGKERMKQTTIKKITQKAATLVDILEIIVSPFSVKKFVKLISLLTKLFQQKELLFWDIYRLIIKLISPKGKL